MRLNSATALFETEFKNDIDLAIAGFATVAVDDNPTTNLDFATLSGVLSGSGSLAKSGAGTLQLLGANTYTGDTILSAGTLTVTSIGGSDAASSSLGGAAAAPLRMNAGTLIYAGSGETADRPIHLGASVAIDSSGTGAVVLRGVTSVSESTLSQTLTLRGWNRDRNEITSPLANGRSALALLKTEDSTWILSGPNTFTGGTNLNTGTLGIGPEPTTAASILLGLAGFAGIRRRSPRRPALCADRRATL